MSKQSNSSMSSRSSKSKSESYRRDPSRFSQEEISAIHRGDPSYDTMSQLMPDINDLPPTVSDFSIVEDPDLPNPDSYQQVQVEQYRTPQAPPSSSFASSRRTSQQSSGSSAETHSLQSSSSMRQRWQT